MIFSKNKKVSKEERAETPTRLLIKRFKSNKLAMTGLIAFIILMGAVLITKIYVDVSGYNLAELDLENQYVAPNLKYLFGTDKAGRNMVIRVFLGGTISFQVGLIATLVTVILGVVMGGLAGYYGGKIDMMIMRLAEVVYVFPFLPIAMIIAITMRDVSPINKVYLMMVVLGIISWSSLARMVRGQILSLREQEFMIAAKALGIKNRQQIFKHLVPNVVAYVIVSATNVFAGAILTESTLAYLGLSVSEPIPTWGSLIQQSANSVTMENYWWLWIFPGLMLFILIMSVNLIGEGLRDAIDPKSNVKYVRQKKSLFNLFKKSKKVNANE